MALVAFSRLYQPLEALNAFYAKPRVALTRIDQVDLTQRRGGLGQRLVTSSPTSKMLCQRTALATWQAWGILSWERVKKEGSDYLNLFTCDLSSLTRSRPLARSRCDLRSATRNKFLSPFPKRLECSSLPLFLGSGILSRKGAKDWRYTKMVWSRLGPTEAM